MYQALANFLFKQRQSMSENYKYPSINTIFNKKRCVPFSSRYRRNSLRQTENWLIPKLDDDSTKAADGFGNRINHHFTDQLFVYENACSVGANQDVETDEDAGS